MEYTTAALGCDGADMTLNSELSGAEFSAERLEEACLTKIEGVPKQEINGPLRNLIEALQVDFAKPRGSSTSVTTPSRQQVPSSEPVLPNDATRLLPSKAEVSEEQDIKTSAEHYAASLGPLTAASTASTLPSLPFKAPKVCTSSEVSREDQAEGGVMNLWWCLIQDQLATLNREIDSLRHAHAQLQARQGEAFLHQSESDKVSDNVIHLARLLEAERHNRVDACEKIWEAVKAEQSLRAAEHKELDHAFCQLKVSLCEEFQPALRDNLGAEINRQVAVLRDELACETESRSQSVEELVEHMRKMTAAMKEMEKDKDNQGSCLTMLQSQFASLDSEFRADREDWVQKRGALQGKILQSLGDQEEMLTKERQARVAHEVSIEARVASDNKRMGDELKEMLVGTCDQTQALRQILDSEKALREQLQTLSSCEMVSKVDFASEIKHLWQAIHEALKTRTTVQQPATARTGSPVPSTARTSSPIRRFVSTGACLSQCSPRGEVGLSSCISPIATQPIAVYPGVPSRQAPNRNSGNGQCSVVAGTTSSGLCSMTTSCTLSSASLNHR